MPSDDCDRCVILWSDSCGTIVSIRCIGIPAVREVIIAGILFNNAANNATPSQLASRTRCSLLRNQYVALPHVPVHRSDTFYPDDDSGLSKMLRPLSFYRETVLAFMLCQLTADVRALAQALGVTPAALLAAHDEAVTLIAAIDTADQERREQPAFFFAALDESLPAPPDADTP
jgi:hypothetical protein